MAGKRKQGLTALLLSGLLAFGAFGLAGCGDDNAQEPPNQDAEPEEEQPMGTGPMSNDGAGETPSDEL